MQVYEGKTEGQGYLKTLTKKKALDIGGKENSISLRKDLKNDKSSLDKNGTYSI